MLEAKKEKIKVSIGIPAYNEELNIKPLVQSLINQDNSNFDLIEIIVVSDRSEDKTIKKAKEIGDPRIVVIENLERRGQALSQNVILDHFHGELLLLLNADVMPNDSKLIEKLVKTFRENKNVGIVGGKVVPLEAENWIEKVINYSVEMKQELYESLNDNGNLYLCHGRIRAFSKEFAKNFRWVKTYGEDAFSYLSCISAGYVFLYDSDAIVRYRSPQTIKEHLKQSLRFLRSRKKQSEYFNSELVKNSYKIPLSKSLSIIFRHLFKDPVKFLCYLVIFILAKINILIGTRISPLWEISYSSKKL